MQRFLILCIAVLPAVLFAKTAPQFISKYTNLTKCKVLEEPGEPDENGPNDSYLAQCPGRGGYTVYEK